ncbi:integral membrane protein [Phlyctema vagabunda]|uniref:Integral membrane protein n=1 Tax=Phlyctema vagabunda TaxID=108571 RepID=A0ABR4PNH8_9HELO
MEEHRGQAIPRHHHDQQRIRSRSKMISEVPGRSAEMNGEDETQRCHAPTRSNRYESLLISKSDRSLRKTPRGAMMSYVVALMACLFIQPGAAVFLDFQNCLSESYQHDTPLLLQFVPLFVDAVFNTTDPAHNLRVTVWGNVTGSLPLVALPGSNDTEYWNSNTTTAGKIVNVPDPEGANKLTTSYNKVNVLTYEPWSQTLEWCKQLVNGTCPLGPSFTANASIPHELPSFSMSNNFYSTYAFTSLTTTMMIKNGDAAITNIGCVSVNITPDLGSTLSDLIKYIPVIILIVVGIATAFAGVFSPWGSADTFRWTTNYGRDADLLRLVTPGFGDCLQYIQFVALTGGLTLNYPGFYQPIVSKVSWSTLMFNQSFVRNTTSYESLVDGMYVTDGKYGLDQLRQLVGLGNTDDVWTGMVIWLLVIIASVLAFIQIGFAARWAYRQLNNTQEEDLRAKNFPFSFGNVVRIIFNYFLLPIVALSMYQLVVAGQSPAYTVGLAAVLLIIIVGFAIWLLYLVANTRPRSFLFDDLPTVLLYGSLYNTYSDNAAPFALVPVLLTFVRGVSIGAVQASGIAQLVLLAICEVLTILSLHAFRPFHSATSNNAYHTIFAAARFASLLLMTAFAPSLGVTEGPKGWIGYAILLLHALVLILLFLLNAIQTIVEVTARMAGAGGDETGVTRGGLVRVFGMRQLSRRLPRGDGGSRASHLSSAAMLDSEADRKDYIVNGNRMRAESAGSNAVLLNRQSTGLDSTSADPFAPPPANRSSAYTPTTPGESSFSFLPSAAAPSGQSRVRGPVLGLNTGDASDPYYRPPRLRRPTIEAYSPGAKSRGSWASGDWGNRPDAEADVTDPPEGPSISGRVTPVQQAADTSPHEARRSQADYATREVDFYYGVRGPALNANIPSRRIKTGPADPTGIPASAAGWFKGLFGGKTKEKGKGFEVVRSSRMPPAMMAKNAAPDPETPPEGIPIATGGVRNGPIDSDSDDEGNRRRKHDADLRQAAGGDGQDDNLVSPLQSDDEDEIDGDQRSTRFTRISDMPPSLPGIEASDGIELPSRFPSKASSRHPQNHNPMPGFSDVPLVPSVPRKSSRRKSLSVDLSSTGAASRHKAQGSLEPRLPFDRSGSNRRHSAVSSKSSVGAMDEQSRSREGSSTTGPFNADAENDRPMSTGYVHHHNIHTVNPSENPSYMGSSAEVVNERD